VDRCLRERIDTSRITLEGKELDYRFELDGGLGGRIWDSRTVRPVKAELEIDITKKRITIRLASA
jgi:hypothetical protein